MLAAPFPHAERHQPLLEDRACNRGVIALLICSSLPIVPPFSRYARQMRTHGVAVIESFHDALLRRSNLTRCPREKSNINNVRSTQALHDSPPTARLPTTTYPAVVCVTSVTNRCVPRTDGRTPDAAIGQGRHRMIPLTSCFIMMSGSPSPTYRKAC
ncbi:hypothetical protein F4818DRAFT_320088 [Hypoxylon cercidicola]|nr:hypothetical protein F4818DRAFT_320088 [Hypoxylon cercidicola]